MKISHGCTRWGSNLGSPDYHYWSRRVAPSGNRTRDVRITACSNLRSLRWRLTLHRFHWPARVVTRATRVLTRGPYSSDGSRQVVRQVIKVGRYNLLTHSHVFDTRERPRIYFSVGNLNYRIAMAQRDKMMDEDDLVDYTESDVEDGEIPTVDATQSTAPASTDVPVESMAPAPTVVVNVAVRCPVSSPAGGSSGSAVGAGPGAIGAGVTADVEMTDSQLVLHQRASSNERGSSPRLSSSGASQGSSSLAHSGSSRSRARAGDRINQRQGSLSPSRDVTLPPENAPMAQDGNRAVAEPERLQRVTVDRVQYPSPSTYDELDFTRFDAETDYQVAKAPWFNRDAVLFACDALDKDEADGGGAPADPLGPYVDVQAKLPGGIPRAALDSWVWKQMFCASDSQLAKVGNSPVGAIRESFVKRCRRVLSRLLTRQGMKEDISDLFVYRTRG